MRLVLEGGKRRGARREGVLRLASSREGVCVCVYACVLSKREREKGRTIRGD